MLKLKDFMETTHYRITEGGEYGWSCYGPRAYSLDYWNGIHDDGGYSLSIVFDTETQLVYEGTVCDYTNQRAYRLMNPEFRDAFQAESAVRGASADEAWEDVNFCDLETVTDFLEKSRAIVAGEDYSTTVEVPITMDKDDLYQVMMMAHERNMTLNELANDILSQEFERILADEKSERPSRTCTV